MLEAARRELKRLELAAERARRECDECIDAGGTMIELHLEMKDVIKTGKYDKETLAKIDDIDKRYKAAKKAAKKDMIKLMDKQSDSEFLRDEFEREMLSLQSFLGMRKLQK